MIKTRPARSMDDFTLARIVHVAAVLFWIGGVAFVTWVVMPAIRHSERASDRLAKFHAIEGRFSTQAKVWVLLAGASGFWMVRAAPRRAAISGSNLNARYLRQQRRAQRIAKAARAGQYCGKTSDCPGQICARPSQDDGRTRTLLSCA